MIKNLLSVINLKIKQLKLDDIKILNDKTINDPEIFNKESLFTFKNIPKDVAVSPKSIKTEQKEKTKMIL